MTTQAVDALRRIHEQVEIVIGQLDEADFERPSACEGWRVQDVFAHLSSNMKETADPTPPPDDGTPPDMGAEAAMEALVAPRRSWTAQEVLDEYERYFDGWIGAMAAMQDEPTASTVAPLADLGSHPLHLVANAFAFDHYCHLHIDLLAPSGPLDLDLGEPDHDVVRPGIDWMMAGMPQMQPLELAEVATAPLRLVLTGPGAGTWVIGPPGEDGFVTVTEDGEADVVATMSSSAHDFVSWGTKRSNWRGAVDIEGDETSAAAFLDTLNII